MIIQVKNSLNALALAASFILGRIRSQVNEEIGEDPAPGAVGSDTRKSVPLENWALAAAADPYPTRSVRIVVPYNTGGSADVLARHIATGLQQTWGQGVVVDNRAGASGNIGSAEVVRAPADGYTLLLQNSTMVGNLAVM